MVRVSLPVRGGATLFLDGIAARPGEIVTHGPGHSLHERTDGPCRWRVIWLPALELTRYARAMSGTVFDVPPGACRWRPMPGALRVLTGLYDDAMRASKVHPELAAGAKAARGLEQQVIAALVECLQIEGVDLGASARIRHARIMDQFENFVRSIRGSNLSVEEISPTIGIPAGLSGRIRAPLLGWARCAISGCVECSWRTASCGMPCLMPRAYRTWRGIWLRRTRALRRGLSRAIRGIAHGDIAEPHARLNRESTMSAALQ